jgi:hypothetical protein
MRRDVVIRLSQQGTGVAVRKPDGEGSVTIRMAGSIKLGRGGRAHDHADSCSAAIGDERITIEKEKGKGDSTQRQRGHRTVRNQSILLLR